MSAIPEHSSAAPVTTNYARHVSQPSSRWTRRWLLLGAGLVVVVVGVGAARSSGIAARLFGRSDNDAELFTVHPQAMRITLTEDGELKPKNSTDVKCGLEGQSTILWVVPESTRVKKGDLLVELASDEIKSRVEEEQIQLQTLRTGLEAAQQDLSITLNENDSKIKKAEIDADVAKLEFDRYIKGDYQKSLQSVEIDRRQTEIDIAQKTAELEKNQKLRDKGFVPPQKVTELEAALEKARMTLEKNKLERKILEEYERPKNEKEKGSAVVQAEQELARERERSASREKQARAKVEEQQSLLAVRETRFQRMKDQLAKCKILAPTDGIVQYPSDEGMFRMGNSGRIAAGEKAYEGQALVSLPDTSQMIVSLRIHEADRHRVHEGLPCLVRVPAVPGRAFHGTISKIARFADSEHRWLNPELKEHATEVLLEETDAPVSPGDSAEIEIQIEEVPDTLAVPVQCVFARGQKRYVFTQDGGSAKFAEVKVGKSSNTLVQVLDGLSNGDRVLMHVPDDLLASLPAPKRDESAVPENQPVEANAAAAPKAPRPGGGPGGGGGAGHAPRGRG